MTLRLSNPHYSLVVHQLYIMGMETKETGDTTKSAPPFFAFCCSSASYSYRKNCSCMTFTEIRTEGYYDKYNNYYYDCS